MYFPSKGESLILQVNSFYIHTNQEAGADVEAMLSRYNTEICLYKQTIAIKELFHLKIIINFLVRSFWRL